MKMVRSIERSPLRVCLSYDAGGATVSFPPAAQALVHGSALREIARMVPSCASGAAAS
jgi:hypothetical protein